MMEEIALSYVSNGFLPIPVPLGTKAPKLANWPELRIDASNVTDYFADFEQNLGILLGVGDNVIADVDCDCREAIVAAEHLLPPTPAIFGRRSKPSSHYLYRVGGATATKQFRDPARSADGAMIVELRGAGAQTLVPPSLNPTGERVRWAEKDQFRDVPPIPSEVDEADLQKTVEHVAAAALLARHWPRAGEGRHDAMLALAGVLARAKWLDEDALTFCDAVYHSIDGPDLAKVGRVKSEVYSTFDKWTKGENVTGRTRLAEFVGEPIVTRALEWLEVSQGGELQSLDGARISIQLKNRTLDEKVADCASVLKATNSPPSLFFRSGTLVRLASEGNDRYSIREVHETDLSWRLAQNATFLNGQKRTNPCEKTTRTLMMVGLDACQEIPPLEGIVATPVIRPDGTILDTPGYDPTSRLFYSPAMGLVVPPIPENPTSEEVAAALAVIEDVIADFPFKDQSKANALAAILTPIVRPAIEGPTPLAVFDAAAAGTGKTLLAEVVSIIATGVEGAMTTAPKNKDEWRKKITSLLREGSAVVILDNVSSRLDADELMTALSAETWSDRILGSSQQISVPVRCAWIVTSNNIQLDGQIIRRTYWVRMDAKSAQPYLRSDFKHPNLKLYVRQNRGNLLGALLTLARSWFANGKPSPEVKLLGTFESWTKVVGGILENAGVGGFLGNSDELHAHSDDETPLWEALLSQMYTIFHDKPFTVATLVVHMKSPMYDHLKESIELIFGDATNHEATLKQHIAKNFKAHRDKRFGRDDGILFWLEQGGTIHKVALWFVRSNQDNSRRRKLAKGDEGTKIKEIAA